MNTSTYEMTIDLNILKHLGINLHSSIAAVPTELVASAWDANASDFRSRGLHINHVEK